LLWVPTSLCGNRYSDTQKKLILFNKMGSGSGTDFSKEWLHKMANDEVPESKKMKEHIILDFKKVFLPTDKTSRAQAALANLHMKGAPFKGDFHRFRSALSLKLERVG